ncbi:hypothetical protein CEXT_119481 [Caerostris extrusa]|uniref:Uncharacterized protein n=1 Tax=Caerostris extrusa TaxID=172846 RepID=A0AAV4Q9M6_CAEEX|nr:hypothetical protein CEXT_119481 [Caerostris extrusa]
MLGINLPPAYYTSYLVTEDGMLTRARQIVSVEEEFKGVPFRLQLILRECVCENAVKLDERGGLPCFDMCLGRH